MINFEQIKEIKRKLTHARMTIMQAYNSLTFIEEVDLAEIQELSAEHFHFLRTKAGHARIKMGLRLNELFASWEAHLTEYRAYKKDQELLDKETQKPKDEAL